MKLSRLTALIAVALALSSLSRVEAQVTSYTDEAAYLAALTAQSMPAVREGFENDTVWGGVRSTISGGPMTAPSIHSKGLTWTANNPGGEITTGSGAARSGGYGYFQAPHGNWNTGITDGFVATGDTPLVAIGGWVRTNTPYAGISLYLDGVQVSFNGSTVLGPGGHTFFGAIAPAGFSHFAFSETEAQPGDWKFVFADDFTFAFGGALIDCNQNGIGDALDISNGFSTDCDLDSIPDECEIDVHSTAPGGPYFCETGCESDCNANGVLDACELVEPTVYASGQLGPIGDGAPQSYLLSSPATPLADVLVDFRAYANLGGADEYLEVELNGASIGRVFEYDGEDCPDSALTEARLVIPRQTFVNLVGGGSALFELTASTEVDPDDCDLPSHVELLVTVFTPSSLDLDGNGVLDECESLGVNYCFAAPNSEHAGGAHVSAYGSLVVADNNLTLETRDVPANQFGLHYFGSTQVQTPAGDGFRCVGGTLLRLPVTQANSNGVATLPLDLNAAPASAILSGTTHDFQFWYRDPLGGPAAFNFSDGLELSFL